MPETDADQATESVVDAELLDQMDGEETDASETVADGDIIPDIDAAELDAAEEDVSTTEPDSGPTLYDLKTVGEQLGVTYSRIRRFAEAPGVAESLGAVKVKSTQGWRYPEESVGKWRQLMVEADKGLLTPKTAAAWLANQQTAPADIPALATGNTSAAALVGLMGEFSAGSDDSALTRVGPTQILAAMMRLAETLEKNADTATKATDHWYTLVAAAEATGMSQKTIRENVPFVVEGNRRKWARRDLAAYQEQAERQQPKRSVSGKEQT